MTNSTTCAVKGLTKRGYLVSQAMKRTRDFDEIMEKEIIRNTDDTIRCYKVKNEKGEIVGHKMVNVSKSFPISVSTLKKEDEIQEEIQRQLDEAYASLVTI